MLPNKCYCGCGGTIPKRTRKSRKEVKYLVGHYNKVNKPKGRKYIPKQSEIPSGLCECACGNKTNIAKTTYTHLRHFKGYPLPYLRGHGSKKLGSDSNQWKGGRTKTKEGYVLIKSHGHPYARSNNYVSEHRLVMEKHLGRYLEPYEQVHHKDGNKANNVVSNLELWTRSHPSGKRIKDLRDLDFVSSSLGF